jgi:hypothetical protein
VQGCFVHFETKDDAVEALDYEEVVQECMERDSRVSNIDDDDDDDVHDDVHDDVIDFRSTWCKAYRLSKVRVMHCHTSNKPILSLDLRDWRPSSELHIESGATKVENCNQQKLV